MARGRELRVLLRTVDPLGLQVLGTPSFRWHARWAMMRRISFGLQHPPRQRKEVISQLCRGFDGADEQARGDVEPRVRLAESGHATCIRTCWMALGFDLDREETSTPLQDQVDFRSRVCPVVPERGAGAPCSCSFHDFIHNPCLDEPTVKGM